MEAELPLEFPDGTTPVTCRVSIYDSSTDKKVGVGSLMDKASAPPLPILSVYMEEVHVKVWLLSLSALLHFSITIAQGMGVMEILIQFIFYIQLGEELYFTVGAQNIPFGASPQASIS